MLKALLYSLAALSVVVTTDAESTCRSAVNNVPLILPGPQGPPGPPGEKGNSGSQPGGAVYTRWGRTVCPTGATLVYAGIAATTGSAVHGGTSDTLCMPEAPQYLSTDTTATYTDFLNSVEYETFGTETTPFRNVKEHNMPCAVCHTDTKDVVLTIPAQHSCPAGWSNEFSGYLMTEYTNADRSRRDTICVDVAAEAIPGSEANTSPAFIYLLRASCKVVGLPCPPYNDQMVLPCAVCTK